MRYYELFFDTDLSDCWHLKEPRNGNGDLIDSWHFTMAKRYENIEPLTIPLQYAGPELDFTFNAFGLPVATTELAEALRALDPAAVQLVPVQVQEAKRPYVIVNILRSVDCVDEQKSAYTKWTEDGARPDKVGQFKTIERLALKPIPEEFKIFRIKGYLREIVVSDEVMHLFKLRNASGVEFRLV